MKDNDIEDMLDLTFTVNEEVFGQVGVCVCVLDSGDVMGMQFSETPQIMRA